MIYDTRGQSTKKNDSPPFVVGKKRDDGPSSLSRDCSTAQGGLLRLVSAFPQPDYDTSWFVEHWKDTQMGLAFLAVGDISF